MEIRGSHFFVLASQFVFGFGSKFGVRSSKFGVRFGFRFGVRQPQPNVEARTSNSERRTPNVEPRTELRSSNFEPNLNTN